MSEVISILTKEFSLERGRVDNVVKLIDEGNTIPFIARYRKELTGSMDDQLLRELADRLAYLRKLDARRDEIISAVDALGKLTDEISLSVKNAATLAELEDIYRPYKQKRRTRATIAREKGLEPLAALLFSQSLMQGDLKELAKEYINAEKGVETADDALAGASDIIAEDISDNAEIRKRLRELIAKKGQLSSKAAKKEESVYSLYYDFSSPVDKLAGHRILAINRGEREGYLKASIELDETAALDMINRLVAAERSISTDFVKSAAADAYDRLIFPSVEREVRASLTEDANEQAIKMFGLNLKPLLLSPPIKNKVVLGLDPAYRTGCKLAVVDETGKVLETAVIYPTPPHNDTEKSKAVMLRLIREHGVSVISIGNGTASKESEIFVADLIKETPGVSYMVVNEAGASVYSASKLGAIEFPDFDVTQRSAVSIARRLQDPLAELVKIDPKSIGVGQYQHDMPPARLDETLAGVVEDCVNAVGVDLNTASAALMAHISGLNQSAAESIVSHREQNGAFKSRQELAKVKKIGAKTFTQCAGFMRVPESKNILDNTGVHPESYAAAQKLLELCGYSLSSAASGVSDIDARAKRYGEQKLSEQCEIGLPTLEDIIKELKKPGRDMRDELPQPILRSDVMDIKDLRKGMEFTGTVRNVVDFGAFVDIGVHQDGLVHISQICDRYIKHPSEALKVGDVVKVTVIDVDADKKRISLSMKTAANKTAENKI